MNYLEELYGAIKKHSELEDESIIDAANYGADGGFSGFTYNSECEEFWNNNAELIQKFAQEQAEEFGYKNWFELFSNFGRSDMLEIENGFKTLGSWFVLEEVGRWLEEREGVNHD